MDFPSGLEGVFAADKQYLGRKQAQQQDMQNRLTLSKMLQEREDEQRKREFIDSLPPEQRNMVMLGGGGKLAELLMQQQQPEQTTMQQATPFILSESRPEDVQRHLLGAQAQVGTPAERAQALKTMTEPPKHEKRETRAFNLGNDMVIDQELTPQGWQAVGKPYHKFARQVASVAQGQTTINTSGVKDMPRTEGQKASDRQFAKDYVAWKATGGISSFDADMQRLTESIDALESGRRISGPIIGATPDIVKSFVIPEAKQIRDDVGAVVQKSLRAILGGQFAQKEGEALLKRTYDESLEEPINAARVKILMQQLKDAAEAKEAASEHFAQYGTLDKYTGPNPKTILDENRTPKGFNPKVKTGVDAGNPLLR